MLKSYYFQNKETGELVTYEQAKKEFYKVTRNWNESIFDEYIETNLLSDENLEAPNFSLIIN